MEHRWGRQPEIKSVRSIGSNTVYMCQNCLALKVIINCDSGPKEGETQTQIVEFGGCELSVK